jgi:hypothetical protein
VKLAPTPTIVVTLTDDDIDQSPCAAPVQIRRESAERMAEFTRQWKRAVADAQTNDERLLMIQTASELSAMVGTLRAAGTAKPKRTNGDPNPAQRPHDREAVHPGLAPDLIGPIPMKPPICRPKVFRQDIVAQLQKWEDDTLQIANSGLTNDELILLARSMTRILNAIKADL